MPYEVREDVIDQIWRDLGQQVARPRVVEVAQEIAAELDDARVPSYVPLFVRRLACERLSQEAQQPQRTAAPREPGTGHAR
jgi:hypothetical protein